MRAVGLEPHGTISTSYEMRRAIFEGGDQWNYTAALDSLATDSTLVAEGVRICANGLSTRCSPIRIAPPPPPAWKAARTDVVELDPVNQTFVGRALASRSLEITGHWSNGLTNVVGPTGVSNRKPSWCAKIVCTTTTGKPVDSPGCYPGAPILTPRNVLVFIVMDDDFYADNHKVDSPGRSDASYTRTGEVNELDGFAPGGRPQAVRFALEYLAIPRAQVSDGRTSRHHRVGHSTLSVRVRTDLARF